MKDTLTSIADGFRSSRGLTEEISPARMAELAAENVGGGGFPNGTEWALIDVQNINPDEVIYNDGLFVVGAGNGIYYSADGKTWTQSNIVDVTSVMVDYYAGVWVACLTMASENGLYYSIDGKEWFESNDGAEYSNFTMHTEAGHRIAHGGMNLYYSTTWEPTA